MENHNFSREELEKIGFRKIGLSPQISRDARFFNLSASIGDNVRIDAFAILTGEIDLADNVHISSYAYISGGSAKITMEKSSGVSTHVSIYTKCDNYSAIDIGEKLQGSVLIKEYGIIGAHTTILPGSIIGRNCRVGAHCIITGELCDNSQYVSLAAKTIKIAKYNTVTKNPCTTD